MTAGTTNESVVRTQLARLGIQAEIVTGRDHAESFAMVRDGRADALALAGQAARGAGAMLVETGEEAALLRAQVTSPGGSTAAALARLEAHGVRHALADAVAACAGRAG